MIINNNTLKKLIRYINIIKIIINIQNKFIMKSIIALTMMASWASARNSYEALKVKLV